MIEASRPLRGTWMLRVSLLLLALTGCDISVKKPTASVTLVGRVFSADQAKPLAGVEVSAPDGTVVKSGADGTFTLRHAVDKEGPVTTKSADHAPVSKDSPKGDGYLELFVKEVDGKSDVMVSKGGKVEGKEGASVSVSKDTLVDKDGKAATMARVEIASPDPSKPTDLPALPGNFDAKNGEKRGKISAESPVHVRARDGEKELSLREGKSVEADMPARRADTNSDAALFRFDPVEQSWVFVKKVARVGSKSGAPIPNAQVDPGEPVYRAELDELGWWSVGEFFDELTCVRACVVDGDGKGVPFARAVASGVDHFTQLTAYADDKGCFALDVRAKAQISVSVQAIDGFVEPVLIETGDRELTVADDPTKCEDLGELKLKEADAGACPLGLRSCGDACVDIRADAANCGACDNACGGSTGRELSCVDGLCSCPLGQRTCTGEGSTNVDPTPAPGTGSSGMAAGGSGSDEFASCRTDADCPQGRRCDAEGLCSGTTTAPAPVQPTDAGTPTAAERIRTQTAGYCAAVRTDSRNCGGCGNVCGTGSACVNGACARSGDSGGEPAGRADAGVSDEMRPPDTKPDGGVTTACGFCPNEDVGIPNFGMGCCTSDGRCGTLGIGLAAGICVERDQPGTPSTTCPPFMGTFNGLPISMPGCCRITDRKCGYDSSQDNVAGAMYDLGTGCISEADGNTGRAPTSCDPAETQQQDSDLDGIPDQADNCPGIANKDQQDTDGDAVGNACEPTPDGGTGFPDGGPVMPPPDAGGSDGGLPT